MNAYEYKRRTTLSSSDDATNLRHELTTMGIAHNVASASLTTMIATRHVGGSHGWLSRHRIRCSYLPLAHVSRATWNSRYAMSSEALSHGTLLVHLFVQSALPGSHRIVMLAS